MQNSSHLSSFKTVAKRFFRAKDFDYLYVYISRILLPLLTTHHNTEPREANTATHAPPPFQSVQSPPLYTLPGSSHFP